ncbi:MAG: carbon-nitrogen hydrolase [Gammaproteobacteria bacterium]|jgi:N-carbamoylputrescine amidase
MKNTLSVALLQQAIDIDYNKTLNMFLHEVEKAAAKGAQLVCLPELHMGPYFPITENFEHFNRAESIPGPTTDAFSALAKKLNIVIVCSIFERRAAGIYHNTAVVLEKDGSIAGIYRKMHIPDDPGFYEKYYFTPGDLGFTPIKTSVGNLGVLVCWDQWYPEAARIMALKGADLLIYPTAIGYHKDSKSGFLKDRDAWQTIQRSHAIANALPVLVINRVGYEQDPNGLVEGTQFWGHSFIAGPQGEIIQQAGDDIETLSADIDLSETETIRRFWPFLRDRRIDAYEGILQRYL